MATTAGALATRVFRSAPARRRCESFLCKPILLQKRRAGSSYVGDVGVVRAQESHGIPTRNHKESRRGIQHDEPRNARNRRISRENPTSADRGADRAPDGRAGVVTGVAAASALTPKAAPTPEPTPFDWGCDEEPWHSFFGTDPHTDCPATPPPGSARACAAVSAATAVGGGSGPRAASLWPSGTLRAACDDTAGGRAAAAATRRRDRRSRSTPRRARCSSSAATARTARRRASLRQYRAQIPFPESSPHPHLTWRQEEENHGVSEKLIAAKAPKPWHPRHRRIMTH